MNNAEYLEFHKACCEKMIKITEAKNSDYCGTSGDAFANFRKVELLGVTDTNRGFLVRMIDKVSRVISFVQQGILKVKDESVEDTLLDLANYCILMVGYIKSQKPPDITSHEPTTTNEFLKPNVYTDDIPPKVNKMVPTNTAGDMSYFLRTEVESTEQQVAIENGKPLTDEDLSPLVAGNLLEPGDTWGLS